MVSKNNYYFVTQTYRNMISKMYKNIFWLTLFFLAACSLKNGNDKQRNVEQFVNEQTTVKFDTLYHNFGSLNQGEQVAYSFKYRNIGTSDLVIKDVYSTCGCTVANYTKKAVSPNESGYVEIVFDSSGRRGVQYKNIIVEMNTIQGNHTLSIRANVIKK